MYFSAARTAFILLAVAPIWVVAAAMMIWTMPSWRTAVHLSVLALIGALLADLAIVSLHSLPFTCSYLPGKGKLHFVFWGGVFLGLPLINVAGSLEWRLLYSRSGSALMIVCVSLLAVIIRLWTDRRLRRIGNIVFQEEATLDLLSLKLGSG